MDLSQKCSEVCSTSTRIKIETIDAKKPFSDVDDFEYIEGELPEGDRLNDRCGDQYRDQMGPPEATHPNQ